MHKFLPAQRSNLLFRNNLKSKIEDLKWVAGFVALGFALAMCRAAGAQPTKIPRIGYLIAISPSAGPVRIEPFRQGLRELRYVEGKNIIIEWRYAEGKLDRLPALAAELVGLNVDVIVSARRIRGLPSKRLARFPLS